jgi:hypothetical protein
MGTWSCGHVGTRTHEHTHLRVRTSADTAHGPMRRKPSRHHHRRHTRAGTPPRAGGGGGGGLPRTRPRITAGCDAGTPEQAPTQQQTRSRVDLCARPTPEMCAENRTALEVANTQPHVMACERTSFNRTSWRVNGPVSTARHGV